MKTKKIIILMFCIILSVFTNTVFSADITSSWVINDSSQSIKEIKISLIELAKDKNDLNMEFFVLNQNQKLKEFFKEDLSKQDIEMIEIIIKWYLENKKEIETKIKIKASELLNTDNERILLLNEKKLFYKDIVPFIKSYKMEEYIEYITQDVKIFKQQWELTDKVLIKNEIIENKVWLIEEKIKEHREYINDKFNLLINEIITEKIDLLINNSKFIALDIWSKELVLNKILIKIQITITTLEKTIDKTDALVKKLEIYKKVYLELNEIKNNLIN